jgi:hypothetical protein
VATTRLGGVQFAAAAVCAAGGKGEDEIVARDLSDLYHMLDEDEVVESIWAPAGWHQTSTACSRGTNARRHVDNGPAIGRRITPGYGV